MRQQPSKPVPLMKPAELRKFLSRSKSRMVSLEHKSENGVSLTINDFDINILMAEAEARRLAFIDKPYRPIVDVTTGKTAYEPSLLLSLAREDESLCKFFEGLRLHYIECIAMGRLDIWKNAGHAIIELCGSVSRVGVTNRGTLQ